jgi:serine/threonine protein kinase
VEMAATFTVGEQIGRGQYGQVYRATYEGSQVAIKRILIDGVDHEYVGMKKLDHPNVLKLLHLEDKDPFRFRLFSRICSFLQI